jgi:hypothetical protein
MTILLEEDNDIHCYRWYKLEYSEECILLEGREDEDGNYKEGEYEDIVEFMQQTAPHIRWRAARNEDYRAGDEWFDGDSFFMYVPDDQYTEAGYILDRYLKGDDLTNYSYKDRYPEIYVLINGEKQIKPEIEQFYELLCEYEELLQRANEYSIKDFFINVVSLLPRIYSAAYKLPATAGPGDITHSYHNIIFDIDFGNYDEFLYLESSYRREIIEGHSIFVMLNEIYNDIEPGLEMFREDNQDDVATAVGDWHSVFFIEHGWGKDILNVVSAIHCALADIYKKE